MVDGIGDRSGLARAAIEAAQDHVHLQTFIISPDAVGRGFMDLLREKARAGTPRAAA